MKFKENLRYLRRANNISQDELAEKLGYKSFTTVQKWEDGTSFPKVENLNRLAEMFNVELDHLLNIDLTANKVAVPILGEVKAGYDLYLNSDICGYEYCNVNEALSGEYFYLKVKGDSMINDRIGEGDIVYVKSQNHLNENELGVFLIGGDEVTIKRVHFDKDSIRLSASNPKYEDRTFKEDEIRILGKVMHSKVMFS